MKNPIWGAKPNLGSLPVISLSMHMISNGCWSSTTTRMQLTMKNPIWGVKPRLLNFVFA